MVMACIVMAYTVTACIVMVEEPELGTRVQLAEAPLPALASVAARMRELWYLAPPEH